MNENPKPIVSGIIIFLNEEKFIEEAIESVFAQTYDNWELLLVDDGSIDRSTDIARQYAEKYPDRVRYLEHENHRNRGMSASRNLGIRNAQGKYIALLDADDIWLPNKLKDQVAILEAQPEAAMVYGRTHFWYSWTGNPEDARRDRFTNLGIEPNRLVQPPALLKLFLEDELTIASTCSILLRREIFDKLGGFEENFRDQYEDMIFYTKLYLHEPVYVADGCWDRYRHHAENSYVIPYQKGEMHLHRRRFLLWIEQYLLDKGYRDTEVWRALQRELFANRHPNWHRQIERIRHPLGTAKNLVKKTENTLPAPVYEWLRERWNIYRYTPPLGKTNWGDLRGVKPISPEFCGRGQPVDRYYIDLFLASHAEDIRGHVLEIGDPGYTRAVGGDRVRRSDVFHAVEGNPNATLVGDLASAPQIPSDTFDCFILTQTLQYLYDLPSAVKTVYRVLKPGGVALVTLPCLTPLHEPGRDDSDNDGSWSRSSWYWGFTPASARRLFEESFPPDGVSVRNHGNVMVAIAFLEGLSTPELKTEELDYQDPGYPVLITVRAVKPE